MFIAFIRATNILNLIRDANRSTIEGYRGFSFARFYNIRLDVLDVYHFEDLRHEKQHGLQKPGSWNRKKIINRKSIRTSLI